jgi:hypothetical protein
LSFPGSCKFVTRRGVGRGGGGEGETFGLITVELTTFGSNYQKERRTCRPDSLASGQSFLPLSWTKSIKM